MTSDQVLTEARVYSDRLAFGLTRDPKERDEISKAAFLAYLQGFKAGLDHEAATIKSLKESTHD